MMGTTAQETESGIFKKTTPRELLLVGMEFLLWNINIINNKYKLIYKYITISTNISKYNHNIVCILYYISYINII